MGVEEDQKRRCDTVVTIVHNRQQTNLIEQNIEVFSCGHYGREIPLRSNT